MKLLSEYGASPDQHEASQARAVEGSATIYLVFETRRAQHS